MRVSGGGPVRETLRRAMRSDAWTIGLLAIFVALFVFTIVLRPTFRLEALAIASLPVAFAAVGQAIVVISGGIDLSIGSVLALTNVIAAVLLETYPELSIPIVVLVLLIGLGITFIASLSGENIPKGLVAGGLGLVLAMVGLDPIESVPRFTLEGVLGEGNSLFLWDGISLVAVTVGLFAIPEIIDLERCISRRPGRDCIH